MAEHLMSDRLAVVSVIDPADRASGTTLGDMIDMSVHQEIMFVVMVGNIQKPNTIDFKVTECATTGGTYVPISGKSITQLTQAGTDHNKQAIINVKSDDLTDGYRYVKGRLYVAGVTGTGNNGQCVLTLAGKSRYSTAAYTTVYGDLASVDEIVA
ncbi:MAG: hypothetical protein WC657_07495 [Candidatus Paceibacterota bacterium]|jgi:hypothetical protein